MCGGDGGGHGHFSIIHTGCFWVPLYVGNEHISHIPTKREEKVTIMIIDSRSLTTFGRRYVIVRLQEGYPIPGMISVDLAWLSI